MTDLQSTFFVVAIIYMVLHILILIGITIAVFYLVRTARDIHAQVQDKLRLIDYVRSNPDDVIATLGATVLRNAFRGVKQVFNNVKKSDTG